MTGRIVKGEDVTAEITGRVAATLVQASLANRPAEEETGAGERAANVAASASRP